MLNRFQFKALVYNWLRLIDQAVLDERIERKRYLLSLAETFPEVLNDEVFLQPDPIEWAQLRQIAQAIFKPSPLFLTMFRELIQDLREQTNQAVQRSEERHQMNPIDEPFIYFPSADYTERLRQQIPEAVMMSAFVDFLLSPLADDVNLEHFTQNQIMLDPLSLWRAYLMTTTIGPGETHLIIKNPAQGSFDIDFDWTIDPLTARDRRERLLIENILTEQDIFKRTFFSHLKALQDKIELRARFTNAIPNNDNSDSTQNESFELQLIKSRMSH